MEIFYTDRAALFEHSGASRLSVAAIAIFKRLNIPDGMPFFLGSDGRYLHVLNAFMRSLPVSGCRSPETWRAYAYDILSFILFLHDRSGTWDPFQAVFEDLEAYARQRTVGDRPEISPLSWNRALAALEKLYDWGVQEGHIHSTPFRYRNRRRSRRYGFRMSGRANTLYLAPSGAHRVKCLSAADYKLFRNVGLLGQNLDGTPGQRPANGERNALIADLLCCTGMRETEALCLLTHEHPTSAAGKVGLLEIPPAIAKRRAGRTLPLPARLLLGVERYRAQERALVIASAIEAERYKRLKRPLLVERVDARSGRSHSPSLHNPVRYQDLVPAVRSKVYFVKYDQIVEPAQLFLGQRGEPLTTAALRRAFDRASKRCEEVLGRPFRVTPHVLRHTFAVHFLARSVRALLGRRHRIKKDGASASATAFQTQLHDPLNQLRVRLGHRSIETTQIYLTHIIDHEDELYANLDESPADAIDLLAFLDQPNLPKVA